LTPDQVVALSFRCADDALTHFTDRDAFNWRWPGVRLGYRFSSSLSLLELTLQCLIRTTLFSSLLRGLLDWTMNLLVAKMLLDLVLVPGLRSVYSTTLSLG
jgi:hypothetical protein